MAVPIDVRSDTATDFACPKQPDVLVPLSRLNDGICDCCDGSDEDPRHGAQQQQQQRGTPNPCPDDCERVLRAERERKAKIHNNYLIGSRKRDLDLANFAKLRSKKLIEISKKEEELKIVQQEIDDIEGNLIVKFKEDYARSRAAAMKNFVLGSPIAKTLVSGLETDELKDLLIPLCQVAGEIAKSDGSKLPEEDTDDCIALRLAALDIGMTWSGDGNNLRATLHGPTSSEIALILFDNALEPDGLPSLSPSSAKNRKKPRKSPKGRRRLDEMDDDYPLMLDDDYIRYQEDDYMDDEEEYANRSDERGRRKGEDRWEGTKRDPRHDGIVNEIQTSLFSTARARFLKESQEVLEEIVKILDEAKQSAEKQEENGSDEDAAEPETDGAAEARIDVGPYKTLQDRLREKREIVETGLSWGASAFLFLDAPLQEEGLTSLVSTNRRVLETLFIGTIFYGGIGSVQLWQILQSVLPEHKTQLEEFLRDEADTTCASPWAGSCPPRSAQRGGAEYPPHFLLEIARTFCDEEASRFGNESSQTTLACRTKNDGKDDEIRDVVESLVSLPSSEGNESYFGYSVPTPSDQATDPLQSIFEPIATLHVDAEGLRTLEDKRDAKETEHRTISGAIESDWKEIGGRDQNALGRDGELHSITDQCFEIVAGKYTYEMCISGQAKQREGSKKGSGTNLGRFKGIEYLDDDAERDGIAGSTRALTWKDGAKCWNGPKRSATVYMTCGPEHKVISANEPDTCRYVFEMESYLACDEAYKTKLGL